MMLFTTLVIAAMIIAAVYFGAVRFIPWPMISYLLMVVVGVACLLPGDVHFRYIGIEVAALGSLVVWLYYHLIRKPITKDTAIQKWKT
jgi:drug/metabolite transporter (DMT)-like permease